MNREWHKEHAMPRRATAKERIEWHLEHTRHCGCRPFPKGLLAELSAAQKRQVEEASGRRGEQTSAAVN